MPDLVGVGRVGRPHGLDGSFVVEDASEDPPDSRPGRGSSSTVRRRGRLVEAGPRAARDPARPDVERGAVLEVRRPTSRSLQTSYYVVDLVGLDVEEEGGRRLGLVREVEPGVANDVLELDSGLALPLHEACVLEVDVDGGRIVVARGFAEAG